MWWKGWRRSVWSRKRRMKSLSFITDVTRHKYTNGRTINTCSQTNYSQTLRVWLFSDAWSVIYNTWWDPLISAGLMILSVCVQTDLVSTIGESVALGVAGVILWGDSNYASSHVSIRASTHCLYINGGLEQCWVFGNGRWWYILLYTSNGSCTMSLLLWLNKHWQGDQD